MGGCIQVQNEYKEYVNATLELMLTSCEDKVLVEFGHGAGKAHVYARADGSPYPSNSSI
jgi:hypothetical protein